MQVSGLMCHYYVPILSQETNSLAVNNTKLF